MTRTEWRDELHNLLAKTAETRTRSSNGKAAFL